MARSAARRLGSDLLVAGLCAGFLLSGGASIVVVGTAADERHAFEELTDVRLALASISSAEAAALGGEVALDVAILDQAYTTLDSDLGVSLGRLTPLEREQAQSWLADAIRGVDRLREGESVDANVSYFRLQTMLDEHAVELEQRVNGSRKLGLWSLVVAGLFGLALVGGLVRNRTRSRHLETELYGQIATDPLTGLYSRQMLEPLMSSVAKSMEEDGCSVAFMYIDADRFKDFNDSVGYWVGDQTLVELASRVRQLQRRTDRTVRMGGDEFVALLYPVEPGSDLAKLSRRFSETFDKPIEVGGRSERLMFSIGVSATSDPARLPEALGEAELALYQAKRSGGNQLVEYSPALTEIVSFDRQIGRALDAICLDDELSLHYQPIVVVETGEVSGFEALLRWTSPCLGEVSPALFIPVAEQCGHIARLGEWVADRVCQQVHQWDNEGLGGNFTVSFNVSPLQLADKSFAANLLAVFDRWPEVDRSRLVLEVTESSVLDQKGVALGNLSDLRDAGMRIAIDDFGSGYSNLGQLFLVPFDVVKLDRSLLPTCARGSSVVEAVMSMVGVFDASVVFEGVESAAQLEFVRSLKVGLVQGRLTGGPVHAGEVPGVLSKVAIERII